MDIEYIKALSDIVCQNGLTKLEVCEGENKICIEKACAPSERPLHAYLEQGTRSSADICETNEETLDFNNIVEVKSPIVGVFYSSPSPDAEAFVTIGSKVKKGDVLCIIEAMKLMNEITAECDGEIVDICIKNGDIAEYGQVLFKIF